MPIDDIELIKSQLEQAKAPFRDGDFVSARQTWEDVLNRQLPPALVEELKKYGGVDIETPDVEKAFHDHVSILHLGTTTVNLACLEQNQKAKEDVEEVAAYLRAWDFKLFGEDGGKQMMNEGQVGPGVAILRILWDMLHEFDWPQQDKDESLPDYAMRSLKARDAYFSVCPHNEFRLQACDWRSVYWGPKLHDPDVVFEDVEVPFWEWRKLKNKDGQFISLDEAGKVAWLGTPLPYEENKDSYHDKTLHVLYRAYKTPEHGWKLTTYVYTQDVLKDGEILEEVDVPGKLCPYVIVPSGNEVMSASDPHRRYRPGLMLSLYTLANEFNWLMTVLLALARKEASDDHIYIDTVDLTPEKRALLEEIGVIDGSGQQRRLTVEKPDTAFNEWAISPRLRRRPESIKEAFIYAIDYYRERIKEAMASRFLTGSAFEETREGTGTAVQSQSESAQFVYQAYEEKQTTARKHVLRFIANSLMTWELAAGKNAKPYYAPTTQAFLDNGGARGARITLDKLQHAFEIAVVTRNETQSEMLNRHQMADHDLQIGLISVSDWARRRDIQDVEKWADEMAKQRLLIRTAQQYQHIELQSHQVLLSATAGFNALGMPVEPPAQGPQQTTPMPQRREVIQGDAMGAGARMGPGIGGMSG